MRQYERKGLILGVIDGEGLGDGIPKGKLMLVEDNLEVVYHKMVNHSSKEELEILNQKLEELRKGVLNG